MRDNFRWKIGEDPKLQGSPNFLIFVVWLTPHKRGSLEQITDKITRTPKETMSLLGTDFIFDNNLTLIFSPKNDSAFFER
jgi:hypothetical protein